MKKLLQFDIEKAKAGAKVETREGRPVRIVCYDKKPEHSPILALVKYNGTEVPTLYHDNGIYYLNYASQRDLVIVEEVEDVEVDLGACTFDDRMSCTIKGWMLNRFEWKSMEELLAYAMIENVGFGVMADQMNYAMGKSVSDMQALLDNLVRKGYLAYTPANKEYTANQYPLNNE